MKSSLALPILGFPKKLAALLGTQEDLELVTPVGKARKAGEPYDPHRLELFASLAASLSTSTIPNIASTESTESALRNLAFFEAYFSNYIEGTEFEVEEAAEIIFENKINVNRPADSHDILGTYRIVANTTEMMRTPANSMELSSLLKTRHEVLMEGRPDKEPGRFKETPNRAGNTVFVLPELVQGTINKGFDLYKNLQDGLAKAIFMIFYISEIHPFNDGNGRVARVMMNSELVLAKQCRIIVPTVYHDKMMPPLIYVCLSVHRNLHLN